MKTVCHKQLSFESFFNKEVIADFDGGHITSDGGSLLLKELDKRYQITEAITSCLTDNRCPDRITHELLTIVRQRVMSIAMGYEDTNDAAKLRNDPAVKITAEKLPLSDPELASQPTLSRFENATDSRQLRRLSEKLFDLYIKTHSRNRPVIVLDIDSTDDPTHGAQQLSFFHGFYDQQCFIRCWYLTV